MTRTKAATVIVLRVILSLICLVACRRTPTTSDTPIALALSGVSGTPVMKVGDSVVTAETLQKRLDALGPQSKERYRDDKEMRMFVDNQIRFELLAREAMRRGFDKDAEVQDVARKAMVQKLLSQLLDDKAAVPEDIASDDSKRFYEKNLTDYKQPERTQIAWIAVVSSAEGETVKRELLQMTSDEAGFERVQKSHMATPPGSEQMSRYWSPDDLAQTFGEPLANAVSATREIGQLGPIVASGGATYVFKVTGRKAPFSRPYDQAENQIRQRMWRERRGDAFESLVRKLREETQVTIYEQNISSIWSTSSVTSSVPNGVTEAQKQ